MGYLNSQKQNSTPTDFTDFLYIFHIENWSISESHTQCLLNSMITFSNVSQLTGVLF